MRLFSLLVTLFMPCLAFLAPPINRAHSCWRAIESAKADEKTGKGITISNPLETGPGHITSFPISTARSGQLEVGRLVLAMAVFWLTAKMKLQEVLSSREGSDSGLDVQANPSAIVELEGGVKYQELFLGKSLPNFGDTVVLETSAFYNGLALGTATKTEFLYSDGNIKSVAGTLAPYLSRLPDAVGGLRVGGTRQVALPCPDGLAPFVPKGAVILATVQLQRPKPST